MKKLLIGLTLLYPTLLFAQNGSVKGKVLDATNNEALPFVNVVVTGTTIGVTSDDNGNFMIKGIEPGFITLTASFVGYQTTQTRDISISNSSTPYIEINMQEESKQLEEVVVKTQLNRKTEESPLSLKTIGISEIETSPGSNRDISKVIQSYPGVGSTPSFRNDVIVRGGGPSESRFYLDGVEIPNLNHFATQGASGGAVGILNADLIGGVNFYSGAFPANRGNALSGVFDFTQIDGNRDRQKVKGSVGASEVTLTLDGPVGEKSSYIASFRRSYLQFLFSAIGLPFLPTFNDYQVKYRTRFNSKNEFTLVSIGALDKNRLNTGIKNPTPDQEYILSYLPENEQWSYTIGGVYKHFNPHSNHTLVVSRNMLNNAALKYENNDESRAKTLDYQSQEIENKIRYEITTKAGNYKITYGLSSEYAKYNNVTSQLLASKGRIVSVNYSSELDLLKYGAFAQVSSRYIDDRLTLSAGVRTDGNTYNRSMSNPLNQMSPRVSASFQLTEKVSLNANAGRYFQLPAYTMLGYRDANDILVNKQNNISYISAYHLIEGVELRATENIIFTVEGFGKWYDRYPMSVRDSISLSTKGADFGVVGDEEIQSNGTGRAYGIEFMNRTRAKWFFATVAYTLVRSEFKNNKGEYIPTSWDSKHIITATASAKTKKNWGGGLKWKFIGGLPYTPYDLTTSSRVSVWDATGQPQMDMSRINSERFTPYHQLDIRIDKRWFWKKISFMAYLDVQNLYNYQIKGQDLILTRKDSEGNDIVSADGQYYELESITNYNGTRLPTVGLMVEF